MQVSSCQTVVTESLTNLPEPPAIQILESQTSKDLCISLNNLSGIKSIFTIVIQKFSVCVNKYCGISSKLCQLYFGDKTMLSSGRDLYLNVTCQFGADNNTIFFRQNQNCLFSCEIVGYKVLYKPWILGHLYQEPAETMKTVNISCAAKFCNNGPSGLVFFGCLHFTPIILETKEFTKTIHFKSHSWCLFVTKWRGI